MANSIFQKQIQEQYQQFRQNPTKFLVGMEIGDPKAMIEKMSGHKIPDEYANNPYGYLQSMVGNMPQQQGNAMLSMAQMFYGGGK